jgi:hypothetical protein
MILSVNVDFEHMTEGQIANAIFWFRDALAKRVGGLLLNEAEQALSMENHGFVKAVKAYRSRTCLSLGECAAQVRDYLWTQRNTGERFSEIARLKQQIDLMQKAIEAIS